MVDTRRKLDRHAQYHLLDRPADPECDLAVERGLCRQCVADHPDVLGGGARLCNGQHLLLQVLGFDQQSVYLLDRG